MEGRGLFLCVRLELRLQSPRVRVRAAASRYQPGLGLLRPNVLPYYLSPQLANEMLPSIYLLK